MTHTEVAAYSPVPIPDPDTEAFWQATAEGQFALCRCGSCRTWMHPPLERCRRCGGPTAFEPVSGRGQVFSFIVVRHQAVPGHPVPYVVALVELEEQTGLRVTGVLQADPDTVTMGAPVEVSLAPVGESGFRTPEFKLADAP
jgi:uncharacterized OB-fold protein